jgi:hypothetical protein
LNLRKEAQSTLIHPLFFRDDEEQIFIIISNGEHRKLYTTQKALGQEKKKECVCVFVLQW